uniref:NmrA-like family domain-containing protein 1 n=1 Tax=Catharus ustulatus TaxID=91951 RepID=A0A8C3UM79_CATUS
LPWVAAAKALGGLGHLECWVVKQANLTSTAISFLLEDDKTTRQATFQNHAAIDFLLLLHGHECQEFEGLCCMNLASKAPNIHTALRDMRSLNMQKLTGGQLEMLHFDGKGVVEEYFQKIGVPTTIIRLPFYFENFLAALKPQKKQGDTFVLELPMGDAPMDAMAVEDLGPIVLSLLKSPGEYIGQVIGLSTGKLTEAEYAAVLSQQTGKNVTASKITPEEWEKRDFPGGKQTANMFRFYALMPDRNNVALTMKLNPKARTFQQWAGDNKNFL